MNKKMTENIETAAQTWFQIKHIPLEIRNTKTFEQFYHSMTSDILDFSSLNFIMMCEYNNNLKKYISNYKNKFYNDEKKEAAEIDYSFNDLNEYASKVHIKKEYDFENQNFSFTHKRTLIIGHNEIKNINFKTQDFDYIKQLLFHIDKDNKVHIFQSYQEPMKNIKLFCYHVDKMFPQTTIFNAKDVFGEYTEITNSGLGYGVATYFTNNHQKFVKLGHNNFIEKKDTISDIFYYCQQNHFKIKNDDFQEISEKEYLAIAKSILELLPKEKQKEMSNVLTKAIK